MIEIFLIAVVAVIYILGCILYGLGMLVEWLIGLEKPTPEKCECPNSIPQTTRESAMDKPNPKPEPEPVNPAYEKAKAGYEEAKAEYERQPRRGKEKALWEEYLESWLAAMRLAANKYANEEERKADNEKVAAYDVHVAEWNKEVEAQRKKAEA